MANTPKNPTPVDEAAEKLAAEEQAAKDAEEQAAKDKAAEEQATLDAIARKDAEAKKAEEEAQFEADLKAEQAEREKDKIEFEGALNAEGKLISAAGGVDPSDAPKISVRTTGDFMLIDPYTGQEINHEGTTEVFKTTFVQDRLENGDLEEA